MLRINNHFTENNFIKSTTNSTGYPAYRLFSGNSYDDKVNYESLFPFDIYLVNVKILSNKIYFHFHCEGVCNFDANNPDHWFDGEFGYYGIIGKIKNIQKIRSIFELIPKNTIFYKYKYIEFQTITRVQLGGMTSTMGLMINDKGQLGISMGYKQTTKETIKVDTTTVSTIDCFDLKTFYELNNVINNEVIEKKLHSFSGFNIKYYNYLYSKHNIYFQNNKIIGGDIMLRNYDIFKYQDFPAKNIGYCRADSFDENPEKINPNYRIHFMVQASGNTIYLCGCLESREHDVDPNWFRVYDAGSYVDEVIILCKNILYSDIEIDEYKSVFGYGLLEFITSQRIKNDGDYRYWPFTQTYSIDIKTGDLQVHVTTGTKHIEDSVLTWQVIPLCGSVRLKKKFKDFNINNIILPSIYYIN